MFPLKVVQIQGNLKDNNFTYRLCPNTEFSSGIWQCALSSVCCEAQVDINTFCNISSNFSVNKHFSQKGELETYAQPLATIHMNLKRNATNKSINR